MAIVVILSMINAAVSHGHDCPHIATGAQAPRENASMHLRRSYSLQTNPARAMPMFRAHKWYQTAQARMAGPPLSQVEQARHTDVMELREQRIQREAFLDKVLSQLQEAQSS